MMTTIEFTVNCLIAGFQEYYFQYLPDFYHTESIFSAHSSSYLSVDDSARLASCAMEISGNNEHYARIS